MAAPRVAECAVQLEAKVEVFHGIAENDPATKGKLICFEVKIERVHVDESILADGEGHRIDPDKWRPLIMSFQRFYGLRQQVHKSTLAQIPESMYRAAPLMETASLEPNAGIITD